MSVLTQSDQCGTWFVCSILRELAVSNLGQPLFCLSITWSRYRNAYRDLWIMTIDQIHKSPNALVPYPTMYGKEMCTFLFWMVHCRISDWCIVGFVNLVYFSEIYSQITQCTHLSHIPQCTIQNRNVHISVLNGALWDIGLVHCGICELGLFPWKLNKLLH